MTFWAKYAGRCRCGCGKRIEVGDEIVWFEGEIVLPECGDRLLTPGARGARGTLDTDGAVEKTCAGCFLVLPLVRFDDKKNDKCIDCS